MLFMRNLYATVGTTAFQPPLCKGRWVAVGNSEGLLVDFICFYKFPQSFFRRKNDSPLKDGAETRIELYIP